MTHEQLLGKYARLQEELAAAYEEAGLAGAHLGRVGRIDRIADDLAAIERSLAGRARAAAPRSADTSPQRIGASPAY